MSISPIPFHGVAMKQIGVIGLSKVADLTGQKFGKLTALQRVENGKDGKVKWKCLCECGNYKIVSSGDLKSGNVKSCGCLLSPSLVGKRFGNLTVIEKERVHVRKSGGKIILWRCKCDCGNVRIVPGTSLNQGIVTKCEECVRKSRKTLIGEKFGKLVVIKRAEDYISPKGKHSPMWLCKCKCGKIKAIAQSSLKFGTTKSCGCSRYESKTKHGLSGTRLYGIWSNMKRRCNSESDSRYNGYGGRGITYCNEWEDFSNFSEWALKNGYKDGLTIERKDVNGNYCPENCCWIPQKEQAKNRRPSLRLVDKDGNERLVVDIAEELGISANVVRARYESGWDLYSAVYTPLITQTVKRKVLKLDIDTGAILKEYESIGKAAKDVGVDRSSISRCCSGKLNKSGGFCWKYAD